MLAAWVYDVLPAGKAGGAAHLDLDGILIRTDRVAMRGPNGADLWWSGKRKHHGGNTRVPSHPDGIPLPGRRRTPRPGARHRLREESRRPAARVRVPRGRTPDPDPDRPRIHQPLARDPPPAQQARGRRTHRAAGHVQQDHPRRTRHGRTSQRPAQGNLHSPATRQPQPHPHRRDRQSHTRPTPPRTPPTHPRRPHHATRHHAEDLSGTRQTEAGPEPLHVAVVTAPGQSESRLVIRGQRPCSPACAEPTTLGAEQPRDVPRKCTGDVEYARIGHARSPPTRRSSVVRVLLSGLRAPRRRRPHAPRTSDSPVIRR